MSLRFLYRKLPVNKRLCSHHRCQKPILRNIARDKEGRLYHYGCLNKALDEQYRCLECYLVFDATEAAFDEKQVLKGDDVLESLKPVCPSCGCPSVKQAGGWG